MLGPVLTAFVAFEHVLFFVLESFLWKTPFGRRVFGTTPEIAEASAPLAANQGLYNAFLAAGLVWSLTTGALDVRLFFLSCVVVAGIVGGLTAKRSIIVVQGVPAALALLLTWLGR
jgi:putative membrane protein